MFNLFKRCKHENIRCIHGDEIVQRMRIRRPYFARAACVDCGRALYGHDLPETCTATNTPHFTEKRRIA